jgi:hypothetical protein
MYFRLSRESIEIEIIKFFSFYNSCWNKKKAHCQQNKGFSHQVIFTFDKKKDVDSVFKKKARDCDRKWSYLCYNTYSRFILSTLYGKTVRVYYFIERVKVIEIIGMNRL